LLLDIGPEAFAIDRPVEDASRCQLVAAQRAEEGQRAPVAMGSEAAQALALRPPAAQRRHVGLDPGFVDEDEPLRIDATLPQSPASTPAGDVGAGLLKREQCFFEAQALAPQELPHRIVRDHDPTRGQFGLEAVQGQVRVLADTLGNEGPLRLKNPLSVSVHLARRNRPRRPMALRPLHHRGH
jgi:hypothetical protein